MKRSTIHGFLVLLMLVFFCGTLSATDDGQTVKRYGLFVGANRGGYGRVMLRYAESDAAEMAETLVSLGGIDQTNRSVLMDPSPSDLKSAFSRLSSRIGGASGEARRTEFIFYYSGHSDEQGLLLGGNRVTYRELKQYIQGLEADVHIAILDSCASGAFTRLKGGTRTSPFLLDTSSEMKGHAFLTSSSEDEASQESDRIGGSFFTHYLISGLRGAADSTMDGRISLNEAYQHAFDETLSNTELTLGGPQHPSYDIQLTGSGDLVLTDVSAPEAAIVLSAEMSGRISIRNANNKLVAELHKYPGIPITLALDDGVYTLTMNSDDKTFSTTIELARGDIADIEKDSMQRERLSANRLRGDIDIPEIPDSLDGELERPENIPVFPSDDEEVPAAEPETGAGPPLFFSLAFVPGFSFPASQDRPVRFQTGFICEAPEILIAQTSALLNMTTRSVTGLEAAGIGNISGGPVTGLQTSGVFNINRGNMKGVQASGVVNINSGELAGLQATGTVNINRGNVWGLQASGVGNVLLGLNYGVQATGVFNYSGDSYGMQATGIFNLASDVYGLQAAGVFNMADNTRGVQASGVFNWTDDMDGMQAAGIFNRALNFRGIQAGLVNIAKNVTGMQVGLVNISENIDGMPIGLINISKNGIYNAGFWYEGGGNGMVEIKLGSRHFYTTVYGGGQLSHYFQDFTTFVKGAGVGFRGYIGNHIYFDIDVSAKHTVMNGKGLVTPATVLLFDEYTVPSLRMAGGVSIGRYFAAFAGVALDFRGPGMPETNGLTDGAGAYQLNSDWGTWSFAPKWFVGLRI